MPGFRGFKSDAGAFEIVDETGRIRLASADKTQPKQAATIRDEVKQRTGKEWPLWVHTTTDGVEYLAYGVEPDWIAIEARRG